jgi:two-component system sensor histidine kinase YesM
VNIKLKWKNSIKQRQLTLLFGILLFNLVCSYLFFVGVSNIAEKAIYEKMEAQANYYLDSVGYQMEGIMKQQVDFFTYRKLFYLASEGISLSGYDKRVLFYLLKRDYL